jgi:Bardet-Biedl syndrome 1 protein
MDVPVSVSTSGLFDIDYTLTTTLRNGHLVLGRRGWVSPLLNMGKPAIGVVCLDTQIIVALMDSSLNCFSDKGRRLWRLEIKDPISCIERIQLKNKNLDMVGVACGQTIHIYSTVGELLDKVPCVETISSIYFGQYGRETNSLAVITAGNNFEY